MNSLNSGYLANISRPNGLSSQKKFGEIIGFESTTSAAAVILRPNGLPCTHGGAWRGRKYSKKSAKITTWKLNASNTEHDKLRARVSP